MIRVVQAVIYDDKDKVRLTLTAEDPAGGWTVPELAALITHITKAPTGND